MIRSRQGIEGIFPPMPFSVPHNYVPGSFKPNTPLPLGAGNAGRCIPVVFDPAYFGGSLAALFFVLRIHVAEKWFALVGDRNHEKLVTGPIPTRHQPQK